MNYNKLSKQAHDNAVAKGFWNPEKSESHYLSLVVSEVCEAIEADRKEKRANAEAFKANYHADDVKKDEFGEYIHYCFERLMKDTVEDELADAMIRLFDLAGHLQIDFFRLPECRYYRVYNRFTFTENAFGLIKGLAKEYICIEKRIQFALDYISAWASDIDIDIEFHVREKMKYNEGREAMHGKKY